MVELYSWIDLHPDLKLHAIYSDVVLEPARVILEDLRIEAERAARMATPASKPVTPLRAELRFNWDHVVPQSWFGKAEPMRGDLHHLFAVSRGATASAATPPLRFRELFRLGGDSRPVRRREANRFEPKAGKGPVVRATLYFLLRYPNHVQPDGLPERSAVLLDWHDQFPPGDYERHRNAAVFARQVNRNPLIDRTNGQPSPTSPPASPATQANRRPYRSGPCLPIVFRGTAA